MIARFDTPPGVVVATFEALIKIVIVESAFSITSEVAIINTIASNAITNTVTILLKTRLI